MQEELPVLYIKPTCPWCLEAIAFLDEHGVPYRRVDITRDDAERLKMERASGQAKVPVLDWRGLVLSDFGVEELVPFLRARNVKLEDS